MHQLTQYMLLSIVHSCLQVSGLTTSNLDTTACVASDKDIPFSFDLQNEGYAQKNWYVNTTGTKIAEQIGTGTLSVQAGYSGRVTAYGSAGIRLSSVTTADSGVYLLVIYTSISFSFGTASTTLSVVVGADLSCKPSCRIENNNPRCTIPEACPAKGSVEVGWFLGQDRQTSDVTCTANNYGKKYRACAVGAAVTACYGGGPLCTDHICTDTPTSIGIGVSVFIGCSGIFFIILFCCGCLDCCLLCRIFPHYKTTKSCNATFYCRKKGCLECFFCKGSKEEKGRLCCSAPKDPFEAETSNRQPSCLCCFCICCDPAQKEAVPLQLKRPQVIHTGTPNKVNSENTSIQKKSLDLPHHLPTLDRDIEDKPKHRPQPLPPGKTDVKDQHTNYDDTTGLANDIARPSKLPPLLAGKQPIVKEAVDLEQPKKKKKKKKGQQDVKNPEEETGEEK